MYWYYLFRRWDDLDSLCYYHSDENPKGEGDLFPSLEDAILNAFEEDIECVPYKEGDFSYICEVSTDPKDPFGVQVDEDGTATLLVYNCEPEPLPASDLRDDAEEGEVKLREDERWISFHKVKIVELTKLQKANEALKEEIAMLKKSQCLRKVLRFPCKC